MNRYFKIYIPVIFITVVLLIVFLQYNSNRSIERLISNNENLLGVLSTRSSLEKLVTNVVLLESKVKGTIISGEPIDSDFRSTEIHSTREILAGLDTLRTYPAIIPLLAKLDSVTEAKIAFNQYVLDTYKNTGKRDAEKIINTDDGKVLTDSIRSICFRIDELHRATVTSLIKDADSNGSKALTLGTVMAIIAVIASIITFGFITYKFSIQQQLIAKLNISEQKSKDAAAIKEKFLANMSHEIRTPLNAIIGYANLLKKKKLEPEDSHFVNVISQSGENLLSIVNDVLDISKIEAGMMRIESAPFNLRSVLHNIEIMFHSRMAGKNLAFEVKASDDIPAMLVGDETRLTQILVNLTENAFKFTPSGKIRISATVVASSTGSTTIRFEITDTGIGIDKAKIEKIFDRFEQVQDSTSRTYGGTGLGLSIVKELVEMQNGTVHVQSEKDKGTCIQVTIPYVRAHDGDMTTVDTAPMSNLLKDQGINILVVEDNLINRELIVYLLTQWNMSYEQAETGIQALQLLKSKTFDLVLLDIQMPEMDGYTTAKEIRNTLKLKTPVIAMTAHAMPGERDKCLSFGMNEYISKPIVEQELLNIIQLFAAPAKGPDENPPQDLVEVYQVIDVTYLHSISRGDTGFEKTVVAQYIEMVPRALLQIQNSYRNNNINGMKHAAHDMKSTIAVMGYNATLMHLLDTLEHGTITRTDFEAIFDELTTICRCALAEAGLFLKQL